MDLDYLGDDDEDERRRRKMADVIPVGLRVTPRQTVTGLVKQTRSAKRFRLDELVDRACEPLQRLLGKKRYFFSDDKPSSLDCLALSYVSLALKPDVPQKWLSDGMQERFSTLCAFAERGINESFGGKVSIEEALSLQAPEASANQRHADTTLPWRAPTKTGLQITSKMAWEGILQNLPFSHYNSPILPSSPPSSSDSKPESTTTTSPALIPAIITTTTAIAAAAGFFFYSTLKTEPEKRSLADMGEAGAIFAGLDFGGVKERGTRRERERGVIVERKGL